jgi:hypothetical protein
MPVEVPASSVHELERVVGASRFLTGELIDVPDADGVCGNRLALIPVSRVQLIVESE